MITIYVAGKPRAQPRGRSVRGRVVSITDKSIKMYRTHVTGECAAAARQHGPLHGPVSLELKCWFATKNAKLFGQPYTPKPDEDNLLKLFQDAAERGGLLPKGDAKVTHGVAWKFWAPADGAMMTLKPHVVETAEDDDLGACPVEQEKELTI